MDLRERIGGALVKGARVQEVATRFCVSHDSVRRLQLKHQRGANWLTRIVKPVVSLLRAT